MEQALNKKHLARLELPILGIHCASCVSRVESALHATPGVQEATVNFATPRATVQFDPQAARPEKLARAVKEQGYEAAIFESPVASAESETLIQRKEYRVEKIRFIVAALLSLPVAMIGMGSHVLPPLEHLFMFPGRDWVQLILTTPVLFWTSQGFLVGAWRAAKH
jgi:cation transport ATPase